MKRRFRALLPVFWIALVVQIFAPIGACWAMSLAAADPLRWGAICSSTAAAGGQSDHQGQHRQHDGCCSNCFVSHAVPMADNPQINFVELNRAYQRVIWLAPSDNPARIHAGLRPQARAPPAIS